MRVYTESAFCIAESYYFLGNYEKAADMFFKCNLEFIEDEADFYIHIGHALLDAKMPNFEKDIRTYYRGCLDQSFQPHQQFLLRPRQHFLKKQKKEH